MQLTENIYFSQTLEHILRPLWMDQFFILVDTCLRIDFTKSIMNGGVLISLT